MSSKTSRLAVIGAALVIAIAAFVVLRPSDEEEPAEGGTTAAETEPEEPAGESGDREREPADARPERPEPVEIELEGGEPVGGVETIEAELGDTIRFTVISDAPDEIHVHGFEITEQVAPDEPAEFSFPAEIEGIYEVEAHDAGHVPLAELRVGP